MNIFSLRNQLIALGLVAAMTSCQKDDVLSNNNDPSNIESLDQLTVPENFTFATTRQMNLSIAVKGLQDQTLSGVRVEAWDKPEILGGRLLATGVTNSNGVFEATTAIPTSVDELVITAQMIGIPTNQVVSLNGSNVLNLTLGGTNPTPLMGYEVKYPNAFANIHPRAARMDGSYTSKFSYRLGAYDSQGKPRYLEPTRDNIPQALLSDINTALPESRPVPSNNPEYLLNNYERNVVIKELSDVYVTFITEGAGYLNSLFYYAYNKNNPPRTANDIDSLIAVFPNASLPGSGGDLSVGSKVKIGRFGKDTVIGFALIANGWNGSRVGAGNWALYSNNDLNPESTASLRQHTVAFWDDNLKRLIVGFEDIRRDSGSDNDYNDCIFFASSNPVTAIDNSNCKPIPRASDRDNDGVDDRYDEYPDDKDKATNNYTPSATGNSTLAFEDLWPSQGDYDFNDLTVAYRFNRITNGAGNVTQIRGRFWLKSIGASFKNGFGFELPINAAQVKSVTRSNSLTEGYITTSANGTEAGQNKATIIVFDNAFKVMPGVGSGFVNTTLGVKKSTSDTIDVVITLNNPVSTSTLGSAPFNPFLIKDKNRSVEIHLSNMTPTTLANTALLGTNADKSNTSQGKYYVNKNNLPWAINIDGNFEYPIEKVSIHRAYLRFATWASSGGTQYRDWYSNTGSGYRNASNIYR